MTKISELGLCKNECCADKIRAAMKAGTAYGRATPTLSAAMELPEVRALRDAADKIANWTIGGMLADDPKCVEKYPLLCAEILNLRAALAPFTEAKP